MGLSQEVEEVSEKALVKAEAQANAISEAKVKYDANDDVQMARMLVKSGAFGDVKEVAQAMAKIQAGREMGFTPVQSLASIHFIQGRLSMGANLIASCIKRSRHRKDINGYDYRVVELTDQVCKLEFFELLSTTRKVTRTDGTIEETPTIERISLGMSPFTVADARKQSTKNMEKFPRNMLFARALTNGARWFTPDVFGGAAVYTPEELGAEVGEDGRVRQVSNREVGTVEISRADVPSLDAISAAPPATDRKAEVNTSLQPKKPSGRAAA